MMGKEGTVRATPKAGVTGMLVGVWIQVHQHDQGSCQSLVC